MSLMFIAVRYFLAFWVNVGVAKLTQARRIILRFQLANFDRMGGGIGSMMTLMWHSPLIESSGPGSGSHWLGTVRLCTCSLHCVRSRSHMPPRTLVPADWWSDIPPPGSVRIQARLLRNLWFGYTLVGGSKRLTVKRNDEVLKIFFCRILQKNV